MPKSIIVEGKTTQEAISNGLNQLNVSKDKVDIKVLEEHEKRSFFSILAPRVVKVEMTLKEEITEKRNTNTSKNETAETADTVNITISIDGVEKTQNKASITDSSFKAYSYTSTGTHEITVKVGSTYTRTRKINFDESDNNRNVIFDKNTASD